MSDLAKSAGPEVPTLVERFTALLRLPHWVGCLLFGFLVGGPLTNLEGRDPVAVVASYSAYEAGERVLSIFAFSLLLFAPAYMRKRVLQAEHACSSLLPEREEGFHRIFGRISAVKPQIVTGIVMFLPVGLSSTLTFDLVGTVSGLVAVLGFSSFLWVYVASLKGIHNLGNVTLRLTPYYLDRTLGLRPIGSLGLSLAVPYLGLIGLVLLLSSSWIVQVPLILAFMLSFVVLGVALFFLPMLRLHRLMVQQKGIEREKLRETLAQMFPNPSGGSSQADLAQMLRLEMMERKVSAIATWPFDIQILGKLITIVLSLVAILLSRWVANLLGI